MMYRENVSVVTRQKRLITFCQMLFWLIYGSAEGMISQVAIWTFQYLCFGQYMYVVQLNKWSRPTGLDSVQRV